MSFSWLKRDTKKPTFETSNVDETSMRSSTYRHDVREVAEVEAVQEEMKLIKSVHSDEDRETFTIFRVTMAPNLNKE